MKTKDRPWPTHKIKGMWESDWPLKLSPLRLFVLVAVLIFVSEIIVMLALSLLPPMNRVLEAVIDSCSLLILLSPVYFFLFLPLKKFYLKHQRADVEIHFLSRQLLTIVEEERQRIALDLHDACGQTVAALQYKLGTLALLPPGDDEGRQKLYAQINVLVQRVSNHIRNLTSSLRPVMLEHLGLAASIEWHLAALGEQWPKVRTEFEHDNFSGLLRPEVEIALFRICQEALNNVVRHADAQGVKVTLERTKDLIRLQIRDDGRGFDLEGFQGGNLPIMGIGLLGMRERIEGLGGRFQVKSVLGAGTTVTAELPDEEVGDERSTN